jgi:uncharacterized protein (TIGR02284 family)
MTVSTGVDTLNAIIAIALDGASTLAKGADMVKDRRVQALFTTLAAERDTIVASLQAEVRSLGGVPEDRGTVVGSAHRLYTEVKSALAPNDHRGVIDEIQRSEERVRDKFRELLERDKALPPATRDLVERQFERVQKSCLQVTDLRVNGAARPRMAGATDEGRSRRRRHAASSNPRPEAPAMKQRNEGEGNKTAAKEYNEATKKFARSGQVERKAEEALAARSGAEKQSLEQAEKAGRRKAKEEDPQVRREPVKPA